MEGSAIAIANLASLLINDGFISAADRLLSTVTDSGKAAESIANAKAASASARRRMEQRRELFYKRFEKHFDTYRSSVLESFRMLSIHQFSAFGEYIAEGGTAGVLIDSAGANCRILFEATQFSGILSFQIACFSGTVTEAGSALMFGKRRDVTILILGNERLKLLIWPENRGNEEAIIGIVLSRVLREGEQRSIGGSPP